VTDNLEYLKVDTREVVMKDSAIGPLDGAEATNTLGTQFFLQLGLVEHRHAASFHNAHRHQTIFLLG
jgi:hypothetical protein